MDSVLGGITQMGYAAYCISDIGKHNMQDRIFIQIGSNSLKVSIYDWDPMIMMLNYRTW